MRFMKDFDDISDLSDEDLHSLSIACAEEQERRSGSDRESGDGKLPTKEVGTWLGHLYSIAELRQMSTAVLVDLAAGFCADGNEQPSPETRLQAARYIADNLANLVTDEQLP